MNLCSDLGLDPVDLLEIPIMLPFYIPLGNGVISQVLDEGGICSFWFNDFDTAIEYPLSIYKKTSIEIKKTQILMIYIFDKNLEYDDFEMELTNYFNLMLNKLNDLIVSYLIKSKDYSSYFVSREMLQTATYYRLISIGKWITKEEGVFIIHKNIPYIQEKISNKLIIDIIKFQEIYKNKENHFMLSEELVLNAIRNFKNGFYKEAIFFIQTSIETFINNIYILFLIEEGLTKEEAEEKTENMAFITIVKKEMPPRMGGNWDITRSGSMIGKWYNNCYMLRNAITHNGYRPMFYETERAINDAINLRSFLIDLIYKNSRNEFLRKYFIREE